MDIISPARGHVLWLGLCWLSCSATSPLLAQQPSRAEVLASNCTSCHGPAAQGSLRIPSLRTLDMTEIIQSMIGFRTGEERETIMARIASALSDEEIELIAEALEDLD